MAILNFPTNPALDQTYIANNVIYTWNGEYWEANTNSGFDSRYVEVGGDNMTGDLTLGTDKITLNAADGSITAAGAAKFLQGANGYDSQFLRSGDGNSIFLRGDTNKPQGYYIHGSETVACFSSNGADVGSGSGSVNIDCSNGSIDAAGDVKAEKVNAKTFWRQDFGGARITFGLVDNVNVPCILPADVNGGDSAYDIHLGNDSAPFTSINVDKVNCNGSAVFADRITTGTATTNAGLLTVTHNAASSGAAMIRGVIGTDTANPTFLIKADGSAEFADELTVTNGIYDPSSSTGIGARITPYGSIDLQRQVGTQTAIRVFTKDQNNVSIFADGSGEFAGSVISGTLTGQFTQINPWGFIKVKSNSSNVANSMATFEGGAGDIQFRVDGSATFAGRVSTPQLFGSVTNSTASDYRVLNVYNTSLSQPAAYKASIFANGDAEFQGTVTATVVPPSDARFKENITPAKPQLADVVALGGLLKNYDWNDQAPLNEELRSQRQLGLIAQEAAEVCPAIVKDIHRTKTVEVTPAVTGPKGRVLTEAVTEEVDDSYKGISQDALIMKLIGAVTELKAELDALKGA